MSRTVGKSETYIGYGILVILGIIASVIFLKQFNYSPAILKSEALQPGSSSQSSQLSNSLPSLVQHAPDGLNPLSPAENFGSDNLSEKINGKAELYLSAGFVHLSTQRFTAKEESEYWLEAFVYDMGSIRNSFAVFSQQRRFEAENADLSEFAYKTENALYFVHGPYYVEIISSVARQSMAELMLAFGEDFVRKTAVSHERIYELDLFPSQDLVQGSISLLPSDAFGFEQFNSIFTAQYIIGETELTAFLSERQSQTEAVSLVEGYTSFLLAQGGTEVEFELEIPDARLLQIMGTFELIFSHTNMLAGVHEAEDKEAAEKLALTLKRNLQGAIQ